VSDIDWSGTEDSDFRGSMLVEGALTAPGKPAMVVVRVQGAPAMFNSTTVYVNMCMAARHWVPKSKNLVEALYGTKVLVLPGPMSIPSRGSQEYGATICHAKGD
jgi:hypothetical protein